MMNDKPLGLFRKLAAIAAEVTVVTKQGRNEFHKYDYVREIDVVAEIRQLLVKHQVLALPSVLQTGLVYEMTNGQAGKKLLTTCDIEIMFVDVETGETLTRKWSGEGQDTGDKGIYKAITGALKYGYLKTFQVPTEDDPENDSQQKSSTKAKASAESSQRKADALTQPAAKPDKPVPARREALDAAKTPPPSTAPSFTEPIKCSECAEVLEPRVARFSIERFGRPLCYGHQELERNKPVKEATK